MSTSHVQRDRGAVLPLVIIIVFVLSTVVAGIARYSTTNLKYGRVAENRTDRLAAADAGMRFALDQIKLRARGCVWDNNVHTLPGLISDFNGATASVQCQRISSGFDEIPLYAAAMTGEGASGDFLLFAKGGSSSKILGGPVYMERIDTAAFNFAECSGANPCVSIENGPLLYRDDDTAGCTSDKPSVVVARASNKLEFLPDLVYGPECVAGGWETRLPSPHIASNLSQLPGKFGDTPFITAPLDLTTSSNADITSLLGTLLADATTGSYIDLPGLGGCRVYVPGHYTKQIKIDGKNSYFLSGNYVFEFPSPGSTFELKNAVATLGVPNPNIAGSTNEILSNSNACYKIQSLDPMLNGVLAPNGEGVTIYLASKSSIDVLTNGSMEIHARKQGSRYVSVQALCRTKGPDGGREYCQNDSMRGSPATQDFGGDGGLGSSKASNLNASTTRQALYTNSGSNKEFVAHAAFYTPLAEVEFGNVSSSAQQKMLGGVTASQLILQSATSATNFEIAVPTSPITGKLAITSTATKEGATSAIKAILEYRPYDETPDDRIAVNSWRVCESGTC